MIDTANEAMITKKIIEAIVVKSTTLVARTPESAAMTGVAKAAEKKKQLIFL